MSGLGLCPWKIVAISHANLYILVLFGVVGYFFFGGGATKVIFARVVVFVVCLKLLHWKDMFNEAYQSIRPGLRVSNPPVENIFS